MKKLTIKLLDLSTEKTFYKDFKSECEMFKYRIQLRKYYKNLVEIKQHD